MLSPRDAFKVGFLLRCADEGLSKRAMEDRILAAQTFVRKEAVSLLKSLGGSAASLGLLLPVALGLSGGYIAAKMMDAAPTPKEVKNEELIEEYDRLSRSARLQTRLMRMLRDREKLLGARA